MGLSSSSSKTTSNQTTTQNSTTTPTNPEWVTGAIQGYTDKINQFGQTDPYSLIAGPSTLQQQAFAQASNLGSWQDSNLQAQALAQAVASAPANLATASGYTAPSVQAAQLGGAVQANVPTLGPAAQMTTSGYTPQQMQAAQAQLQGYSPFLAGPAAQAQLSTFSAPQLGPAATYSGTGYTAAQAEAAQLAALREAQAMSMLEGFDKYQIAPTQALVDTTLADFDAAAGVTRAAQSGAAARNGAFAGSRYGIQEAATEGELARARAAADAQLRDRAFTQAVGMAQFDTGNRQAVNLANAQMGNQHNQYQAGLQQQANLANAGFQNEAAAFGVNAANQAAQFNAGAKNNFALQQGAWDYGAASQNAQSANQLSQFNTGQLNQNSWINQAAQNEAAQFGANAYNQGALANAGFQQQAGLANMDAANSAAAFGANWANQASQFNTGAQNQFGLAQFGANTDAASQYAAAQNQYTLMQAQMAQQAALANAGMQADASQFGAAAANSASQFNATQQNQQIAQQLQAAGLLGSLSNSYAGNQQGDLALLGTLGAQQQQLDQAQALAPLAQLQAMGSLYGSVPFNLFSGQNTTGTATMNGTNITKSTPSLFSQALAAAQAAAAFSDRRLKENIVPVGQLPNGIGLYHFNYIWDPEPKIGVMADEVERIQPEALGPVTLGFATVDYSKIEGWV